MVSCPTRGERTIDQFYTNVKEGFVATALHLLGSLDHNMLSLMSRSFRVIGKLPITFKLCASCQKMHVKLCADALKAQILSGLCGLTVTMNNKLWVTNKVKAAINREEKLHFIEGTRTGIKMLNGN